MNNDSHNDRDNRDKNGPRVTRCLVCQHARRAEFDQALAMQTMTAAEIARLVGCSRQAASRHFHNHLLPAAAAAMLERAPDLSRLDIPAEMRKLYDRIAVQLEAADKTSNWQAIRAFHGEARRDLALLAKLLGLLEGDKLTMINQNMIGSQLPDDEQQALLDYRRFREGMENKTDEEMRAYGRGLALAVIDIFDQPGTV